MEQQADANGPSTVPTVFVYSNRRETSRARNESCGDRRMREERSEREVHRVLVRVYRNRVATREMERDEWIDSSSSWKLEKQSCKGEDEESE